MNWIIILGCLLFCLWQRNHYRQKIDKLSQRLKYYNDKLDFEEVEKNKLITHLLDLTDGLNPQRDWWLDDVPSSFIRRWIRDLKASSTPPLHVIAYLERELQKRKLNITI